MQSVVDFCKKYELPKFRQKQIFHALYKEFVSDFSEITTLSKDLREKLAAEVKLNVLENIHEETSARGDTTKVVFERHDGQKIETVLMQHKDGRNTVCVSSMVGCPVNCSFCATGKMGFGGNLSGDEIVEQVLYFARKLKATGDRVSNIVFMGMGEPMLNLIEVKKALTIFHEEMGIGQRRITVSTSGYVPQLRDLINWGFRGRIAISLHAPNQELREQLMPVAKLYSLDKLFKALFEFEEMTNKRISYEYIMIKGVTDTEECAKDLGNLLSGHLAHVNLIPYNPVHGESFERSYGNQIRRFQKILDEYKVENTVRVTMGDDIDAACGQLVDKLNRKNKGVRI